MKLRMPIHIFIYITGKNAFIWLNSKIECLNNNARSTVLKLKNIPPMKPESKDGVEDTKKLVAEIKTQKQEYWTTKTLLMTFSLTVWDMPYPSLKLNSYLYCQLTASNK